MRYREWCDRVRAEAGELPPTESVVWLSWTAYFAPPDSWSRRKRERLMGEQHQQKPDRDNIDKAVLDCLYPGGDQAIAGGTIEKLWGEPARIEITIDHFDAVARAA
jgi:Holliday junction resolvase RusA-like endonuclease